MRVCVTGASGLIGSALVPRLRQRGHEVFALVRRPARSDSEREWDTSAVDPRPFKDTDAVVHLAAHNIGARRWYAAVKRAIRDSRVLVTRSLAESLAACPGPPQVLVSASAVGYYGHCGDEVVIESHAPGAGFLAEVGRDWEAAVAPAIQAGIRTVLLRTGVVLSTRGGALPRMLPPFRLGLAGRLGSGRQWMSWIALEDLVSLIEYALVTESLRGPVNAVAPGSVTNAEFTRVLAGVLRRPVFLPVPAFAIKLLMGEMGRELLLSGQRAQPAAALASGFHFRYPDLRSALADILK